MLFRNLITALKIWLVHYLFYYWTFGIIFYSISYYHKEWEINKLFFKSILISPLLGIIGLYDGIIIIVPIIIYVVCRLKLSLFKSYLLTLICCYFSYFIYLLLSNYRGVYFFTRNKDDIILEINALFLIIPSLLISIVINYFYCKILRQAHT